MIHADEQKTRKIGSVRGGSSYKFGIYKMTEGSSTEPARNRTNDGEYAWHTKYGETREQAFESIKSIILNIIEFVQNDDLNSIEKIDLGFAYKWKIAFLYGDFNVLNMFKPAALTDALRILNIEYES